MAFRYIIAQAYLIDVSVTSIVPLNVPGVFCNSYGVRRHLGSRYGDVKSVLSRSVASISTCQYPLFEFSAENTLGLRNESMISLIRGAWYGSCLVTAVKFL